jgi:AcrR family transcriptional regulator
MAATDLLLERVIAFAAAEGIADKSLREIAIGVGTSHRMLLYHFGSREGLLAAIVGAVEAQQREVLASLVRDPDGTTPAEVMLRLWRQVSDPTLRPFVRLFFATVGLAVQGTPGTRALLDGLTNPWLDEGADAAQRLGVGADPNAVDASYQLFVDMWQHWADSRSPPAEHL